MIYIGKYVNTHGIKGEIRIISDFSRKDLVFIPGFKIYIKNKEFTIKTYRHHKNYDMVLLEEINNINDIIDLKGESVYIKEEDINTFLIEDLVNYKVIDNNNSYNIKEILYSKAHPIIVLDNNKMIPYVDEFIIKIDNNNKIVYMNLPKDMLEGL